jgi:hypothetical protein
VLGGHRLLSTHGRASRRALSRGIRRSSGSVEQCRDDRWLPVGFESPGRQPAAHDEDRP